MPMPSLKPILVAANKTYQTIISKRISFPHSVGNFAVGLGSKVGLLAKDTTDDKAKTLKDLAERNFKAEAKEVGQQELLMSRAIEALQLKKDLINQGLAFGTIVDILVLCAQLAKGKEKLSLLDAQQTLDFNLNNLEAFLGGEECALTKPCNSFLRELENLLTERITALEDENQRLKQVVRALPPPGKKQSKGAPELKIEGANPKGSDGQQLRQVPSASPRPATAGGRTALVGQRLMSPPKTGQPLAKQAETPDAIALQTTTKSPGESEAAAPPKPYHGTFTF